MVTSTNLIHPFVVQFSIVKLADPLNNFLLAMMRIDNDPDFVSIRDYYAYKLQIRHDDKIIFTSFW